MSDGTSCYECGEELWSPSEARGYCVVCQLRAMREEDDSAIGPDYADHLGEDDLGE